MSYRKELRELWLSIETVAIPIAELRDKYVRFPGVHRRFSQFEEVYRNLKEIETALFEFIEAKKPLFGSKPEREFVIMSRASIANAQILLEIGEAELALLMAEETC